MTPNQGEVAMESRGQPPKTRYAFPKFSDGTRCLDRPGQVEEKEVIYYLHSGNNLGEFNLGFGCRWITRTDDVV